jgi:hypothetical protein
LYYQAYQGKIGTLGFYLGIQTNGLALFSVFGAGDPANARLGSGSTLTNDFELGDQFLSVRRQFSGTPVGSYLVRLTKAEGDAGGDWYEYYLTRPGETEALIGGIRVARTTPAAPGYIADKGIAWTEFWENNYTDRPLLPVPEFTIVTTVRDPLGTNGEPLHLDAVTTSYSTMPNSDMKITDTRTLAVQHTAGGSTNRCHTPGTVPATD